MGKNDQYYAVARGRQVGIYRSWAECKAQTDGFQNPRFKKFADEAEARKFIASNMAVSGAPKSFTGTPSASGSGGMKRKMEMPTGFGAKRSKNEGHVDPVIEGEFADAPVVYTDGACSSNGRKRARAGWGVFWGDGSADNAYGPVYGLATNNRGELIAVEKALEKAIQKGLQKVVVKTDSNLLVQTMNIWIHGWKRKGWVTSTGAPVLNQDVIQKIDALRGRLKVKFVHVRGHAGIDGNEKADELARKGAEMYQKQP